MADKPFIRQVIVVEGRDDTAAVTRAVDAATIETHGYGISAATWKRLAGAYEKNGLIIFTDPDHAGEEIRRRVSERFPRSAHAYLSRAKAEKKGDIGIENARPEDIAEALLNARTPQMPPVAKPPMAEPMQAAGKAMAQKGSDPAAFDTPVTQEDMILAGLSGRADSASRREAVGDLLGIGYANAKSMLKRMNMLGISKRDFDAAVQSVAKAVSKDLDRAAGRGTDIETETDTEKETENE
ncbi:MAG: toprim domain-containing protein [Eubacterium sp.]|jgi:ribonuclease M5